MNPTISGLHGFRVWDVGPSPGYKGFFVRDSMWFSKNICGGFFISVRGVGFFSQFQTLFYSWLLGK